jgi:hypothetical protein
MRIMAPSRRDFGAGYWVVVTRRVSMLSETGKRYFVAVVTALLFT